MSNEKRKRRLTAIDYFIILAVIAVLVAASLRLYENNRLEDAAEESGFTNEPFIVSFSCKGIKESTANLLEKGELYYLAGGETEFGVIDEISSITPAKTRVELDNGELKTDVYAEKNGNNTKVDVTGTFIVQGYRDDDNLMYVEGNLYIAPNMPVTVYSNDKALSFTVTKIEKVN